MPPYKQKDEAHRLAIVFGADEGSRKAPRLEPDPMDHVFVAQVSDQLNDDNRHHQDILAGGDALTEDSVLTIVDGGGAAGPGVDDEIGQAVEFTTQVGDLLPSRPQKEDFLPNFPIFKFIAVVLISTHTIGLIEFDLVLMLSDVVPVRLFFMGLGRKFINIA